MGYVRKDEGNPRQEKIPDQPCVPARIAVCDPGRDKPYAYGTGGIEKDEYGDVVSIANEEVSESVEHKVL